MSSPLTWKFNCNHCVYLFSIVVTLNIYITNQHLAVHLHLHLHLKNDGAYSRSIEHHFFILVSLIPSHREAIKNIYFLAQSTLEAFREKGGWWNFCKFQTLFDAVGRRIYCTNWLLQNYKTITSLKQLIIHVRPFNHICINPNSHNLRYIYIQEVDG